MMTWYYARIPSPVQTGSWKKRPAGSLYLYRKSIGMTLIFHSPMFHQIEGVLRDTYISMRDSKGVLYFLSNRCLVKRTPPVFVQVFFRLQELSAGSGYFLLYVKGKDVVCGGSGWIEILGSGMIDPNVFGHVNYDPEQYRGYARNGSRTNCHVEIRGLMISASCLK